MARQFKGRSETYSSSKSINENVLSVYNKILENAYSDSDYWYLIGNDYLLDMLYDFDDLDLSELKDDLGNWALNELEIFWDALESDYSASHDDLLSKRSLLYGHIITLANKYLNTDKLIAARLINHVDVEFLAKGHISDKNLLATIQQILLNVENALGIASRPVNDYITEVRFNLIKETIQKLYDKAK